LVDLLFFGFTYDFVLQVMVAALKFFLGSDPENEKNSDDSDSDVIFLYLLYLSFCLYAKSVYNLSNHGFFFQFNFKCIVSAEGG
jgi:hypothetical protein